MSAPAGRPPRPHPRRHVWANRALHAGLAWVRRTGDISPGTHAARAFGHLGEGSAIGFPHAALVNPHAMHIGDGVLVGRHVTLAAGYGPGDPNATPSTLVVGDRCVIGARSSLTAHGSIVLDDDVWFGQGVFVSDASHGYRDPDTPIGHQMSEHLPVRIGAGSWLGHGVIVLPGTTIGRQVVVAAGSVVRGEVPDHTVVAGVPARVVRRLEPGVGWVSPDGDVRPVTSHPEQLAWLAQQS